MFRLVFGARLPDYLRIAKNIVFISSWSKAPRLWHRRVRPGTNGEFQEGACAVPLAADALRAAQ
jgi:hypothetical protein